MCGISGVLYFNGERHIDRHRFSVMCHTLSHRGPDGNTCLFDGNLALGHNRLSVQDLSAASLQPMRTPDGRYWIVFNGEIYNTQELRSDLLDRGHILYTKSDTEVLLRYFQIYGTNCIEMLDGMFAFAVWDKLSRNLTLARDPFGIKPLYYAVDEYRLVFASEIKAIHVFLGADVSLNASALADYICFQYTLGEKSLFKDVFKVQPGHWMSFGQSGKHRQVRFWQPRFDKVDLPEIEAANHLKELLSTSVSSHLKSEVPLGFYLSGGIDSASVMGLGVEKTGIDYNSFTVGFRDGQEYNDTEVAAYTADYFQSQHHKIFPDATDFSTNFDKFIWHMDEPTAAPGAIAQFFLSKIASRYVRVTLGGQGADELFGGYLRYFLAYLDAATRFEQGASNYKLDIPLVCLLGNLDQTVHYNELSHRLFGSSSDLSLAERYLHLIRHHTRPLNQLHPEMLVALEGYDPIDEYIGIFNRNSDLEYLDQMQCYDIATSLQALLHVDDRTSMAWSVESRTPFLDKNIAAFAFSLPTKIKIKDGKLKHLLRKAVSDIIPGRVLERSGKIGLPVPVNRWLTGPLRNWLRELLSDTRTRKRNVLSINQSGRGFDDPSLFGRKLWGQICLESWFRVFIDGEGFLEHKTNLHENRLTDGVIDLDKPRRYDIGDFKCI